MHMCTYKKLDRNAVRHLHGKEIYLKKSTDYGRQVGNFGSFMSLYYKQNTLSYTMLSKNMFVSKNMQLLLLVIDFSDFKSVSPEFTFTNMMLYSKSLAWDHFSYLAS